MASKCFHEERNSAPRHSPARPRYIALSYAISSLIDARWRRRHGEAPIKLLPRRRNEYRNNAGSDRTALFNAPASIILNKISRNEIAKAMK